jgi:hypothetical protein
MQDRLPPDRRTSCNARPDHTSGSITTEIGCPRDFRFPLESDHIADIPDRQLRAKCGHSRILKHIAEFFALEKDIRGRSAEERRLIRQQKGRPFADAFQKWLRT